MQAQSLEEVKPPQVDFLRDKSITSIDGVDIKKEWFIKPVLLL